MNLKREVIKASNITAEKCPLCKKLLRLKSPCCADSNVYLVCQCGYKKVKV